MNVLLTPGPALTTWDVKQGLVVPDMCPRDADFSQLLQSVRSELEQLAGGRAQCTCVLVPGSGTTAIESVISSVVRPGGRIVVVHNGVYAQRMVDIACKHGIEVDSVSFDPGHDVDMARVATAMGAPGVELVVVVHLETSTGQLNPIAEIGRMAQSLGRRMMVDAMSSFGAVSIDMVRDGIDFLVTSSNKCLQAMPGLGIVLARPSTLESVDPSWSRSYSLDLVAQARFQNQSGQFRFTPPVQVLAALHVALQELVREGVESRGRRYTLRGDVVAQAMERLGLQPLLPQRCRSAWIQAWTLPSEGWPDYRRLYDDLLTEGYTIYPGILTNCPTFRIATIGDLSHEQVQGFVEAFDRVWTRQRGAPHID